MKFISRKLIELHPFRIYTLPDVLRAEPDPETDWRKFIVRAGRVMETDAEGTDGYDDDPDSEFIPDTAEEYAEITVPEGEEEYWFWLEIDTSATPTTAVVRYGPTPTASTGPGTSSWTSTNPWTSAPVPDSDHIPIGKVDTSIESDTHTAVIRQYLRADIVTVGGGDNECPAG